MRLTRGIWLPSQQRLDTFHQWYFLSVQHVPYMVIWEMKKWDVIQRRSASSHINYCSETSSDNYAFYRCLAGLSYDTVTFTAPKQPSRQSPRNRLSMTRADVAANNQRWLSVTQPRSLLHISAYRGLLLVVLASEDGTTWLWQWWYGRRAVSFIIDTGCTVPMKKCSTLV